jgi:NADH:ubiquinone reductase (non-electrogenic)
MRDGTPYSATGGSITLGDGTTLAYDYLVLALGTSTSDGGVAGARECAVALNTAEDAVRIAGVLGELERAGRDARVAVIGGGLSGVELASVIAERLNGKSTNGVVDVITPNKRVMATAPPGQREAALRVLEKARVNVVGGRVMRLDKVANDEETVSTASKITLADDDGTEGVETYDLVCWTVGQRAETPSDWPVATTPARKIKTDATLRVNGHSRIYAVGDASSSSAEVMNADWDHLPSTAQVAFQQADYAAWNIWASMNGRTELPFRYQHLGDMMVLGSLDAAVAFPVGDITLEGPAAAALRRLAYLYRMPTNEHRLKLGSKWIQDGIETFQKDPVGFLEDIRKSIPFAR